jgi:hypothetical protein
MARLNGKVALVTGGARGQGEAEARLFCAEGARVVIADVLDEPGRKLAAEIGEAARYVRLDVTREEDWARAVAETRSAFGRLDVLVNNAGIVRTGFLEHHSLADYLAVVNVNQVGVFLGMRAVVGAMREAGGGSIVNNLLECRPRRRRGRDRLCGEQMGRARHDEDRGPSSSGSTASASTRSIPAASIRRCSAARSSATCSRPIPSPISRSPASAGPRRSRGSYSFSPPTRAAIRPAPSSRRMADAWPATATPASSPSDSSRRASAGGRGPRTVRAGRGRSRPERQGRIETGVPRFACCASQRIVSSSTATHPSVQSRSRSPRQRAPSPWNPSRPPRAVSWGGMRPRRGPHGCAGTRRGRASPRRGRDRRRPARDSRSAGRDGTGSFGPVPRYDRRPPESADPRDAASRRSAPGRERSGSGAGHRPGSAPRARGRACGPRVGRPKDTAGSADPAAAERATAERASAEAPPGSRDLDGRLGHGRTGTRDERDDHDPERSGPPGDPAPPDRHPLSTAGPGRVARASDSAAPLELAPLIGAPSVDRIAEGDTLLDIAERHRLGFERVARLNPTLDAWIPPPGARVRLPTYHVLPDAPHEGLVVNLPELQLYDYGSIGSGPRSWPSRSATSSTLR